MGVGVFLCFVYVSIHCKVYFCEVISLLFLEDKKPWDCSVSKCLCNCGFLFLFDDIGPNWVPFLAGIHGKAQLQALPAELVHNKRERKAPEESTAPQPGEPGSAI